MKTSMLSVDCHAQIQIVTFLINELKDRLIWWSFTSNIDSYQPHLVFWIWRRKQVWSNVAGKALVIIFLDKYKAFSSLPELQFEWGSDREQHNLLVTMIWLVLTVKVNLLYTAVHWTNPWALGLGGVWKPTPKISKTFARVRFVCTTVHCTI